MGGLDMMLAQVLKGLGLNPEQIGALATGLQDGLEKMLSQQDQILRNQRKIMRELNIPFEEPENAERHEGRENNGNSGDTGGRTGTDG